MSLFKYNNTIKGRDLINIIENHKPSLFEKLRYSFEDEWPDILQTLTNMSLGGALLYIFDFKIQITSGMAVLLCVFLFLISLYNFFSISIDAVKNPNLESNRKVIYRILRKTILQIIVFLVLGVSIFIKTY